MPKGSARTRIDWMPGPAARQALQVAEQLFPHLGRQAVIDRLVLVGLAGLLHPPWRPPALHGDDRDAWTLPSGLQGSDFPGRSGWPSQGGID